MRVALIIGALWLAGAAFVARWFAVNVGRSPSPPQRAAVQNPPKPGAARGQRSIDDAVAEALDDVEHVLGAEDKHTDDRRSERILRSRVGNQPRPMR